MVGEGAVGDSQGSCFPQPFIYTEDLRVAGPPHARMHPSAVALRSWGGERGRRGGGGAWGWWGVKWLLQLLVKDLSQSVTSVPPPLSQRWQARGWPRPARFYRLRSLQRARAATDTRLRWPVGSQNKKPQSLFPVNNDSNGVEARMASITIQSYFAQLGL